MLDIEPKPELERRQYPRQDLVCPCKLFDPRSQKYMLGQTWNVSAGGVMLEVPRPMDLKPGDRIFVGIARKRRQSLLSGDEMIQAQVVRALKMSTQYTAVALQFVQPQPAVEGEPVLHAAA